jgi:hypothetical protein
MSAELRLPPQQAKISKAGIPEQAAIGRGKRNRLR